MSYSVIEQSFFFTNQRARKIQTALWTTIKSHGFNMGNLTDVNLFSFPAFILCHILTFIKKVTWHGDQNMSKRCQKLTRNALCWFREEFPRAIYRPWEKRWRLYILPQHLESLTQLVRDIVPTAWCILALKIWKTSLYFFVSVKVFVR